MKATIVNICGILLFALANNANAVTNSALKSDAAKLFFKSGQKSRQVQNILCDNQKFINCLTLGDIQIGSKFDALRQKLGEPWHTFPRGNGSIDEVYPLRIYQYSTVYWIISHKNNRIIAAQLTGDKAPKTILFAGLQLGDHQDLIIDTLGYPEGRRRYGRSNVYIWDYHPLPFTLEIYNKRLYSVRVHHSNQKLKVDNISDSLLARLTGLDLTPVNQSKNLEISQITTQLLTNDHSSIDENEGKFQNIVTDVQNAAEQLKQNSKQIVNDKITQGAESLTGNNETLNKAIGKTKDILQKKSNELIDKGSEKGREKVNEFISQETKDTVTKFSNKAKETIDQSSINQSVKEIKSIITAEFNPEQQQIIEAVEQWSEAWSQKDIPGYFSAYISTYTPPTSASRNVWQDKRETRINQQAWIKLNTTGFNFPKATIATNNQVTVRFWLEYEVPGYKDKTLKSLTMVKTGNRWLIKQEQSLLVNKM